ncbi:signal-induced proliferation-associated 1-like protein 3 [Gigaspora margarita]|uniref:Signal-induced proliferation-associated 1-like protein 3 n=1 Tax=Gigaspora margarita TaxID=4874 RepID=A0A8H4AHE8_GIGMA|nr:signal-induced proliferation-associated 1-like protein 3 [Gigaspora margarita]
MFSVDQQDRSSSASMLSDSMTASQFDLPIAAKFSNILPRNLLCADFQIEHLDMGSTWYRRFFIEKDHSTFVGYVDPDGPVIISIVLDNRTVNADCESVYWYRYVMRKKQLPDERGLLAGPPMLPIGDLPADELLKMILKTPGKQLLKKFVTTPELKKELLNLDETRLIKCYKIGVLYCASAQRTEEEWFSNTNTSTAYENFLEILGNKVKLKGFDGFTGGLDTTDTEGTGEYSIYDTGTWKDFTIMYHVSTLLPYEKSNKRQITRKRHIGNDVVCIIFQDIRRPFSPLAIRSQFLHVYVVVSPVKISVGTSRAYRVEIVCKDGVPEFGPQLPDPPIFDDPVLLKKFLVATVINGQNAAWKTPKLSEPFSRARGAIVQDIVMRLVPQPNNLITPPTSPKKASQDDLDSSLKRLFKDSLKSGDRPPEMAQIKALLDQGANPNIRLLQPKPSKERLNNLYRNPSISQSQDSSCTTKSKTLQSIYSYSSSSSIGENDSKSTFSQFYNPKLPNILFATIILCDDPVYVKMLIDHGAEVLPKDSHFPNAFLFAAKHGRVEIMKYLLENVPKLSDNENLDNEGDDSQNVGGSSGGIGAKEIKQYGTKIWTGFTGEVKKLKNHINRASNLYK